MAGLGDLDADGHTDFVIGTQARSPTWHKVYSGRQGQLLARLVQTDTSLEFYPVGWGGDLNADGRIDVVVGKPMAGGQVRPAAATAYTLVPRTLVASARTVSLGAGGEVFFELRAAPRHAGHPYLLLATMSGIRPGLRLGSVLLPLNPDPLFWLTLSHPNLFLLQQSLGYLDAKASATARLVVPEGSPQTLYGIFLDHAYVVFERDFAGGFEAASHPVPVQLVR